MFLTRDKPQQGRFFTGGYWTAWTTTTTTLASQWGLLINIDSATGDIAQTASGWIESDRFWFYNVEFAGSTSWEFDTAVTRTGNKTLKLSTLDATGRARAYIMPVIYGTPTTFTDRIIPCKVNTKYIFSCWVKTTNVVTVNIAVDRYASGVYSTSFATPSLTWTNDWTRLVYWPFTTSGVQNWLGISFFNNTAWNISDAWFDVNSMTLEEVVEPVANSLVTPSPSLVSFTAVGSTDNIDTSLDPTFVAANTYTPPVAISETATNKQTFVPTKSKLTRIWIYPVAKGTWNWTVTVHDASNVVQAVITIANASLTNGVVNYFNVPANVTALWTYHFHVTSTVADGTVRVGTAADLETVSYIQNYYKPTTNFKASQNNLSVSVPADEDGFLDWAVINRVNGTYSYTLAAVVWTSFRPSLYSYTDPSWDTANSFYISWSNQQMKWNITWVYIWTFKAKIPYWTSVTISWTLRYTLAEYSFDNSNWVTIRDDRASASFTTFTVTATPTTEFVYVRFTTTWSTVWCFIWYTSTPFTITSTVDVSSLSTLKNYPTNKDIIKQYATTLSGATTSATYRATKWGFPAIEYSATEYQFLDVDTTATGSTVAFSELGTTYTTVADGASLAISSTSNPNIFVKANITANRIYSSSNDFNASSDKDGSLKQNITYQVVQ